MRSAFVVRLVRILNSPMSSMQMRKNVLHEKCLHKCEMKRGSRRKMLHERTRHGAIDSIQNGTVLFPISLYKHMCHVRALYMPFKSCCLFYLYPHECESCFL